jgi:hypothetical protein
METDGERGEVEEKEEDDLVRLLPTDAGATPAGFCSCTSRKGCEAFQLVENMASYAISSSMILVIHENIINGTNHIVYHVFVDISRSQGCKNTTCHMSIFQGSKPRKKKKEIDTVA